MGGAGRPARLRAGKGGTRGDQKALCIRLYHIVICFHMCFMPHHVLIRYDGTCHITRSVPGEDIDQRNGQVARAEKGLRRKGGALPISLFFSSPPTSRSSLELFLPVPRLCPLRFVPANPLGGGGAPRERRPALASRLRGCAASGSEPRPDDYPTSSTQ